MRRREMTINLGRACLVLMLCPELITRCWTYAENNDLLSSSDWGEVDLKFLYCEVQSLQTINCFSSSPSLMEAVLCIGPFSAEDL